MYSNVYERIEKEIKETDYLRRADFTSRIVFAITMVCSIIAPYIIVFHHIWGWMIYCVVMLSSFFGWYSVTYKGVYKYFKTHDDQALIAAVFQKKKVSKKNTPKMNSPQKMNWMYFFRFVRIIKMSSLIQGIHPSINSIIEKYGIKTNEGKKELIEHYRFKAQSVKHIDISLIAPLSFFVSILTIFISNDDMTFRDKVYIIVIFAIIFFSIYIILIYFSKLLFAQFGKKAFYERIEKSLSEIYALNECAQ